MKSSRNRRFVNVLSLTLLIFMAAGCSGINLKNDNHLAPVPAKDKGTENEPYYPTSFKDLRVPGELQWHRENSMTIRTASFAGGILNFTGKVEINSLTDFFLTSMANDNWNLSGSIMYKNILLAFTKPDKTCMMSIFEGDFGSKTEVYIYYTEDISKKGGTGSPVEEIIR